MTKILGYGADYQKDLRLLSIGSKAQQDLTATEVSRINDYMSAGIAAVANSNQANSVSQLASFKLNVFQNISNTAKQLVSQLSGWTFNAAGGGSFTSPDGNTTLTVGNFVVMYNGIIAQTNVFLAANATFGGLDVYQAPGNDAHQAKLNGATFDTGVTAFDATALQGMNAAGHLFVLGGAAATAGASPAITDAASYTTRFEGINALLAQSNASIASLNNQILQNPLFTTAQTLVSQQIDQNQEAINQIYNDLDPYKLAEDAERKRLFSQVLNNVLMKGHETAFAAATRAFGPAAA
jgi:hypothetical protein